MRRRLALAALLVPVLLGAGQTPEEYQLRKAECEGRVRVCWDPADRADTYEIAVASQDEPCIAGLPQEDVCANGTCCYPVSGTECDRLQDGSGLKVRARNLYGISPSWSNVAPMLPCACIEVDVGPAGRDHWMGDILRACEVPCFAGAFDRLPNDDREVNCQ